MLCWFLLCRKVNQLYVGIGHKIFITFAKTVSSIPQDAIGSGRDQGNCDVDELPASQIIEEAKSLNSFQIFLLPINYS